MILAAGRGERMRPLTDTMPKPLLQIAGKSLIEYHIDALVRAGIREIVINHAWLGEKIEAQLGDGEQFGANIQYSREGQALETAGGIKNALHLLGHEPFIVVNGDVFTDYSFISLKQSAEQLSKATLLEETHLNETHLNENSTPKLAHLILVNNPEHNREGDFYCLNHTVQDPKAKKLINEPAYTFSGMACYAPEFFSDMQSGKQALAPMLRSAMKYQQISGEVYTGKWVDIGTPERLNQLNGL